MVPLHPAATARQLNATTAARERGIAPQRAAVAPARLGHVRARFQQFAARRLATHPATARTAGRSWRGTRFAPPGTMLTRRLGEIAREYHQLQARHQAREGARNAPRRRLGHKMAELADRFERLLE